MKRFSAAPYGLPRPWFHCSLGVGASLVPRTCSGRTGGPKNSGPSTKVSVSSGPTPGLTNTQGHQIAEALNAEGGRHLQGKARQLVTIASRHWTPLWQPLTPDERARFDEALHVAQRLMSDQGPTPRPIAELERRWRARTGDAGR